MTSSPYLLTEVICGARTNAVLPAGERLGDGSYLGQIVAAGDHCHASAPVTVRVVECGLDDPAAPDSSGVLLKCSDV
jgi:hypothetical protein